MFVALDVHYVEHQVRAAGLGFEMWSSADSTLEHVVDAQVEPEAYLPGEFYKRELPHLLRVLQAFAEPPQAVIVDAHVWLGAERPGLGARLYEALHGGTAVIGVAKNHFASAPSELVYRGDSKKPLYVTAVGMSLDDAVAGVRSMHGDFRIPTLLKKVDRLARGLEVARVAV